MLKTGLPFGTDYTVYRNIPEYCHSEICAIVIDGTQNSDMREEGEERDTIRVQNSQLSWRELSSLTRVLPDVMKTLVLCYVQQKPYSVEERGEGREEGESGERRRESMTVIDYSSPLCLNRLKVRLISAMVRRLACRSDGECPTVGDIQMRFRTATAKKYRPRKSGTLRKKKRRDVTEIRMGKNVKGRRNWNTLLMNPLNQKPPPSPAIQQQLPPPSSSNETSTFFGWLTTFFGGDGE